MDLVGWPVHSISGEMVSEKNENIEVVNCIFIFLL